MCLRGPAWACGTGAGRLSSFTPTSVPRSDRYAGELVRRSRPESEPSASSPSATAGLVLSAGNPQEDLSTLRKPLGVMAPGNCYSQTDLQALLEQVAKENEDAAAEPRT